MTEAQGATSEGVKAKLEEKLQATNVVSSNQRKNNTWAKQLTPCKLLALPREKTNAALPDCRKLLTLLEGELLASRCGIITAITANW